MCYSPFPLLSSPEFDPLEIRTFNNLMYSLMQMFVSLHIYTPYPIERQ